MSQNGQAQEMVTVTIDDREVTVPKGTNLIEAARQVEVDVPYYCYHPHLSVPGNCRMCQLEVEGAPKLMIGCHTQVQDGMKIRTQLTSEKVKAAQESTLELILINHPLDCTVCDQAGHCKLQDYHYEYNAKPSRFLEEKETKVKAQPLGPTVMLDGERCISCTRCIRFCDEITETSELGLLNRGDRNVISVHPGKELDNPLSGTVVDLCPVGALTHKSWRFNTRMWYANQTESICPGCSTGCNVRVYERDGNVVNVKARLNDDVNKEWLCDEGRYGFDRFLPEERIVEPLIEGQVVDLDTALGKAKELASGNILILLSPDLLVEEFAVARGFSEQVLSESDVVVAYRERSLSDVEAKLVSPDYAANYRGAEFVGYETSSFEKSYDEALQKLKQGSYEGVLLVGDLALTWADQEQSDLLSAISSAKHSVGFLADKSGPLAQACKVVLPARTVLEKSGLMINRKNRLQYSRKVVAFPDGTDPAWRLFGKVSEALGKKLVEARSDRDLTISYLGAEPRLAGLRIARISRGGVCLESYTPSTGGKSAGETSSGATA